MNQQTMYQMAIILVFVAAMYFVLIKPQKKKDKETAEMRNNVQVGDEIVTIGGICGKVVKTKDESIVIQVGADKTKIEFKRWAISSVEKKAPNKRVMESEVEEKKVKPKRLGRKAESMEEEVESVTDVQESVAEQVDEVLPENDNE